MLARYAGDIAHVQVADVPGPRRPGDGRAGLRGAVRPARRPGLSRAGSAASTSRRIRRTAPRASAGGQRAMSGNQMRYDLVVRSRRAVLPDGTRPAAVAVTGRPSRTSPATARPWTAPAMSTCGDLALLPGLVDTHVHVNEPGRTEWEGFATATRAAAAGGVTTICDMPLNSLPPTDLRDGAADKRAAAAGQCWVDVAFWGGAVPGNADALRAAASRPGWSASSASCIDSGVAEFPPLEVADLRAVLGSRPPDRRAADRARGGPGRDQARVRARLRRVPGAPARRSRNAGPSRQVIAAAAATGARAHIVHLSAAECAAMIAAARAAGIRLTAETCPHYLYSRGRAGAGRRHRVQVLPADPGLGQPGGAVAGLEAGVIDCVVSDHSPCPPRAEGRRHGGLRRRRGAVSRRSSSACPRYGPWPRRRGRTLDDVARWMAARPGRAGRPGRQGPDRAAGGDADLVAFDPDEALRGGPGRGCSTGTR